MPTDSIILALTVFKDRTGRNFIPREAIRQIAATASAPVYGPYQTYIDYGIVGGNTVTFEALGRTVGDLVIDAIAGKPVSDVEAPQTYIVDARQLQRWGLAEKDLRARLRSRCTRKGVSWTNIGWRWWRGRSRLVQAGIISALLLERRRRRDAECKARLHLLEAVHLNQSATAGALSSSIAHELNQPLSAIRNNAEAASVLLQAKCPDHELIQQILPRHPGGRSARGDNHRPDERTCSRREARSIGRSSTSATSRRAQSISFTARPNGEGLHCPQTSRPANYPVRADKVHLQQVILNLAINAMDAAVGRCFGQ